MKTTTKIIGLLLLTPFGLNSQQNAQASVTFEAFIDTTYASQGNLSKINYIDLSKKEIEKLDNHLNQFITDSNDACYSVFVSDVYVLSDFKSTERYIKSNNTYLKPYLEGNNYNPDLIKGTKSYLTFNENWSYVNGKIIKENITSGIAKPVFGNDKKFRGHMNIYTKLIKQKSIKKELFKKDVEYDFWFYPYVMDKETEKCLADCKYPDDVKKAVIERNSEFVNGLSQFEIKSFLTSILIDIYSGKLKIYDLTNTEIKTDKVTETFSHLATLNQIDSTGEYVYDEAGNNETYKKYISYKISDIVGINFTEYWYLASNQFDIIKEVKSITFLVNEYNNKREIIGTKQLPFLVKF